LGNFEKNSNRKRIVRREKLRAESRLPMRRKVSSVSSMGRGSCLKHRGGRKARPERRGAIYFSRLKQRGYLSIEKDGKAILPKKGHEGKFVFRNSGGGRGKTQHSKNRPSWTKMIKEGFNGKTKERFRRIRSILTLLATHRPRVTFIQTTTKLVELTPP